MPHDGSGPDTLRRDRGRRSFLAGQAAEEQVARAYERAGHTIRARRWRGPLGELDIVAERDGEMVFVEVKSAATAARAAEALTQRQIQRLMRSAEHFLGTCPKGALTPMRFDVALVDGRGRIEIVRNALMA
ncbi:hypothetical protein roselon_00404 [Roseibacterium elongatum DSM 19469]|uniref:UPF0102 protein roselon_00404 n=1 Tax=Roseicyclus elongatus DSM 19469 TaxID=1294273 RepID=W8RNX5_9RHOB|nr:YraN family protein [Roseibacterium elongatum]AHM02849.1 hypothetical protein roselon_00404 [Roseibacterium elongatum DSM 19469]